MPDLSVRFEPILLVIGIISEILIGIIIGLSVRMLLEGIQLAGQLVGFQMGLSMANVIDPTTSEEVPLLSQLNNLIAVLIFLAINAHYWFLKALVESFHWSPPFIPIHQFLDGAVDISFREYISHRRQSGCAVIVVLLFMSVAFGLAARTVPQMNIFFVAMPLKILVGLMFFVFALPYVTSFLEVLFSGLGHDILKLLHAM